MEIKGVPKRLSDSSTINEDKFRETEHRYRAIFEQSPYGIVIIDTDGKIIEFNEAAHRELGYSRDEFADFCISDIDPFQKPEEVNENMKEVMQKGEARFEVRHRTKAGETRDVQVITRVINLSGRKVFQAIWHDITETKRAEERLRKHQDWLEELVMKRTAELAEVNDKLQDDITRRKSIENKLRDSEERFRKIFDDGPLGMLILSPSLRVSDANKAIRHMLGYTAQELKGFSFENLIYPVDREKVMSISCKLIEKKIPLFQVEKRCLKKDGETLWANIITTALFDRAGKKILYALCMIKDISDRKVAEQEREGLISELQEAMARIKTLTGLLPTCAWCRKIRDDKGNWKRVETFIEEHSDAYFTHGICPECLKKHDPDAYKDYLRKNTS
jgi:PAS domain S-box-containing protein